VVFSFGINDTKIKHGKNFSNTDVYKRNLQKLWEMSRQFTDKVLFVGLTPCVEVQTNPVSWGDTVYTNSRIKEFDAVLKSFCEENGLAFVDTLKAFYDTHNWEKLISDGLHPNGEGHQLIADLVRPKLEEILK
jgi:lysophospholipase L1-like esterase